MQFKFAILAALVSAAMAETCLLQKLAGLTVVTASNTKTRWDVFTKQSGAINAGDVGWFTDNQANQNEVFQAQVAQSSNLFKFNRRGGQSIGVTGFEAGARLTASQNIATFNVACSSCNDFATGNELVGDNCSIELVNSNTGEGLNLCVVFTPDDVVEVQPCDNSNAAQNVVIFSTN
ncbi:hypothetical protein DFH08DRAFT_944782 [Mycena albidolilacea]|uniref:Uncharacterized protein n=1 Tax=Mycena albidolilacea TaxID=1033008 RepID=A0AAD6Z4A8_9AGAR|nr:hypothetical protein DFH08DRAFT_944782 [Mycena albidolilacea]